MIRASWLVSAALLFAIASGAAGQSRSAAESLDEEVAKAIQKGVKNLWDQRQADGSWPAFTMGAHVFSMGPTALAAYALLESGVSPQDERMAVTLDWLAKHDDDKTYSHALRCQVWLLANRKTQNKYRKEFEADVKRLILSAWDGAYTYDAKGTGKEHPYDNSNSQFGVLGVWAGARANMEFIDAKYWQAVLKHWLKYQRLDGGWDYTHTGPGVRPTMTAAGVATLFVCLDNLADDAANRCQATQGPVYKALEKGLEWLEKNFADSLREENYIPNAWSAFMPYYLYGVERVGRAGGYKHLGKTDWYRLGAQWILKRQRENGAWGDQQDTAFALLFLVRGRNPVLFNRLEYKGDWNNRPRALANLTEWMGRSFETPVNWQIVSFKAPVSEWHDAPILLLSGSKAPTFSDEDLAKLRAYVEQGGTVWSVAECGGAAFTRGMKEAWAKMFPAYEMRAVEKDHDLYSINFRLKGRPRLLSLSNGVRPLGFHTEDDLVLSWQMRASSTQAWAFEAAANLALYVSDKGTFRARGVSHWPEEANGPAARRTVKVARIRHTGNWNPEPRAYERLHLLLRRECGVGLDVSSVEMKDLASSGAPLAVLTGTTKVLWTEEEKAALKRYVEGGGLVLADAAGGAKPFAESVEGLLADLYGREALSGLSSSSPILGLPGREIKDVKYRRAAQARLAGLAKESHLRGVRVNNRLAVVWSREDLTGGLVGYPSYTIDGYLPGTAYEIVRNAVLLAGGGTPASAPADAPTSAPGN